MTPEDNRSVLYERSADDPHRPGFHFLPPANWMNDPNGLIQWQGKYHMFYQHNPVEATWGPMHWGHAVSEDMVHWTHLPIALAPTPDGPDKDGCWSGCAVDNDGVPTLMYTGVHPQCQLIATSDDDLLRTWTKHRTNPVIPAPPKGMEVTGFRDPCTWREGDTWYTVIGSGVEGVGGAILLYRSPDLVHWEYMNPILIGDKTRVHPIRTGTMWECPTFIPLGDRHVLIISAMDGQDPALRYTAYLTGDYADHVFNPTRLSKLDHGDRLFYAPQTLVDDQGRRVMFGWIQEDRSSEVHLAAGWAGVMSLPRILGLRSDGSLAVLPAPEVEPLHGEHHRWADVELPLTSRGVLGDARGDRLEILAELQPRDAQVELKLRCSPGGEEETSIIYDPHAGRLVVDRARSSLADDAHASKTTHEAPLALGSDERLQLHVYLDRSVLEIFANERTCITSRIYPTRADSLGVDLIVRGGTAILESLDIWEMRSI
jgi:beta-fructofuranosidase